MRYAGALNMYFVMAGTMVSSIDRCGFADAGALIR